MKVRHITVAVIPTVSYVVFAIRFHISSVPHCIVQGAMRLVIKVAVASASILSLLSLTSIRSALTTNDTLSSEQIITKDLQHTSYGVFRNQEYIPNGSKKLANTASHEDDNIKTITKGPDGSSFDLYKLPDTVNVTLLQFDDDNEVPVREEEIFKMNDPLTTMQRVNPTEHPYFVIIGVQKGVRFPTYT